jgi:hypothetical protein
MKWLLMIWITHAHYSEYRFVTAFPTQAACVKYGQQEQVKHNALHFHCGLQ